MTDRRQRLRDKIESDPDVEPEAGFPIDFIDRLPSAPPTWSFLRSRPIPPRTAIHARLHRTIVLRFFLFALIALQAWAGIALLLIGPSVVPALLTSFSLLVVVVAISYPMARERDRHWILAMLPILEDACDEADWEDRKLNAQYREMDSLRVHPIIPRKGAIENTALGWVVWDPRFPRIYRQIRSAWNRLGWKYARLLARWHPAYRHDILRLCNHHPTWMSRDHKLLLAIWQILRGFVEEELGPTIRDWDHHRGYRLHYAGPENAQAIDLYLWFRERFDDGSIDGIGVVRNRNEEIRTKLCEVVGLLGHLST